MKDGADVTILPTPQLDGSPDEPENYRGSLMRCARQCIEFDEADSQLDGFIVLALYSDGTSSMGYRIPPRPPRPLLPAYIAEILRRDTIMAQEAGAKFDEMFQWAE